MDEPGSVLTDFSGNTITLSVNPDEFQVLVLAKESGRLVYALRPRGETDLGVPESRTLGSLGNRENREALIEKRKERIKILN